MTWAFSDESERAATMFFGVLVVPAVSLHDARREMRGLLLPGQRRVHMAKDGARRRKAILDVVLQLDASSVVVRLRRPLGVTRVQARERLLATACGLVCEADVWILDAQDDAQLRRDRHLIELEFAQGGPVYDHQPSNEEPMLWAVDALLWAYGAGGEAKRRAGTRVSILEI